MEEDIREQTDAAGFCREHYKKMYDYGNALGNALIMQTYYAGLLEELEQQDSRPAAPAVPAGECQLSLTDLGSQTVLRKLRMTDVNILSPIEALNLLAELKRDLNG